MNQEADPTVVDFPLRGEWVAAHTPAERIPSHGTNQFGQGFAFDFMRIERRKKGWKFFRPSISAYLLFGVKLQDCYGWSEPIYAPFDGTVIASKDGWLERKHLHILKDLAVVLKNALIFDPGRTNDLRPVLGNHVVLKMREKEVFALFAHARCGSVRVHENEEVPLGQQLADVGHSGNSTAPHLHFHLMDRANILEAQGLPCRFREYQALHDGTWRRVAEGVPDKGELVRHDE
jgi:hypothetical protein